MPCRNHRTFWGFYFHCKSDNLLRFGQTFPEAPRITCSNTLFDWVKSSTCRSIWHKSFHYNQLVSASIHVKNKQKQHCFFWEQFVSGSIYPPVLNGKDKLQKWRVLRPGEGKSKNCQSNMKFTNRQYIRFCIIW